MFQDRRRHDVAYEAYMDVLAAVLKHIPPQSVR
jgi:hypothetical protein